MFKFYLGVATALFVGAQFKEVSDKIGQALTLAGFNDSPLDRLVVTGGVSLAWPVLVAWSAGTPPVKKVQIPTSDEQILADLRAFMN